MSNSRIKAIVFDFGDVLCFWDNNIIEDSGPFSGGLPLGSLKKLIFDFLHQAEEGKFVSMRQFYRKEKPETPVSLETAEKAFLTWEASAKIDHDCTTYIEKLKRSFKIGLLSNFPKGLEEYLVDRFRIHYLFDAVVSSYNLKIRKPHVDAYHRIANDLGVKPSECVFVDDVKANIDGAERAGMKGLHYQGIEKLKNNLEALVKGQSTN